MFSMSQTKICCYLSSLLSHLFEERLGIMAKQMNGLKIPLLTSVGMEVIHPPFSFSWFCFIKFWTSIVVNVYVVRTHMVSGGNKAGEDCFLRLCQHGPSSLLLMHGFTAGGFAQSSLSLCASVGRWLSCKDQDWYPLYFRIYSLILC